MSEASFSAFFCDDVRREVGGGLSFMGVFGGARLFSRGNVELPKLAICVFVTAPAGYPLEQVQLAASVERGGKIEHRESFPALPPVASVQDNVATLLAKHQVEVRAQYAGVLEMHNFPLGDGCSITVTASEQGQVVYSASTVLLVAQSSDNAKPVAKKSVAKRSQKRR